ncbi:PCP-1.1 protein, partial [Aphelenchoides avenae]
MGRQPVALSIVFAVLATNVIGARNPRLLDPVIHAGRTNGPRSADDPPCQNYDCKVGWLSGIPINHSDPNDRRTFQMQYLYNLDNYDMTAKNGPLFFYTGNEGAIGTFADNTGIMWDLAKQFKAAVVFAEHRFYGMTMPFRDAWTEATRSVDGIDKLSTMDVRQVIEDYAYAIPQLKSALKLPPNAPVIAFGGSYGGMLTGWLALKHPNLLAGAWAASAPLIFFKGSGIDVGAYYAITKRTLIAAGCDEVAILQGFNAIGRLAQSVLGRKILEKAFNVDTTTSPLKTAYDAEGLEGWVREALEYMTMTDYPYPSNFLKPLPGWPVTEACKFLKSAPANLSDYVTLASQIANASFVYYGNDKKHCVVGGCGDDATSGLDGGR